MADTPLHWRSLSEISEQLASRQRTSLEVTEAMLARIARFDPYLGSFDVLTPARALEAARRADQERERGLNRGPLHGVPIAVKALADTAGVRTRAGTQIRAEHVPAASSTVVERLEDAGAVPLGLLTMTEGASAVHHPDVEQPRNPWHRDYWAGASSSGSGVATAAGLCFGSLGSDTAGSIRAPSHFCGVVGLKPTYGRVSRAGVFPLSATLDHVGPMTRTVVDAALMLGVIAGRDDRDPSAANVAVPDYQAACGASLSGVRIGFDPEFATIDVDPELAASVQTVRDALAAAGAAIKTVRMPDWQTACASGAVILHADVALAHEPYFDGGRNQYGPHLAEMIEIGRRLSATDLARAHDQRRTWQGQLERLFSEVDVILCPPTLAPAPPVHLTHELPGDFRTQNFFFRFTLPFTLSGHPSLTVPSGQSSQGLPLGAQFLGRPFEETCLFQVGSAYQAATDWHQRHPDEATWRYGN